MSYSILFLILFFAEDTTAIIEIVVNDNDADIIQIPLSLPMRNKKSSCRSGVVHFALKPSSLHAKAAAGDLAVAWLREEGVARASS